jgi:hypothetical protein
MRSEITHALGQTINEHIAVVGEWSQRAEEGERQDIGGSSAETPGVDFTKCDARPPRPVYETATYTCLGEALWKH